MREFFLMWKCGWITWVSGLVEGAVEGVVEDVGGVLDGACVVVFL